MYVWGGRGMDSKYDSRRGDEGVNVHDADSTSEVRVVS